MSWGKNIIRGVEYDLTHLDPFVIRVRPQAPNAPIMPVRVQFGCHCFTRDANDRDHADFHFPDGKAVRCFCVTRHGWSLQLPAMVRAASAGDAYSSEKHKTFLLVKGLDGGPYVVCFKLRSANSKKYAATMTVVSAYQKPNLDPELPAMPFVALVSRTARGIAIEPGPLKAW